MVKKGEHFRSDYFARQNFAQEILKISGQGKRFVDILTAFLNDIHRVFHDFRA